jgi:hypothetical protein
MKPKQLLIIANYLHLITLSLTEEHEQYRSKFLDYDKFS